MTERSGVATMVEDALADCRAAWAAHPEARFGWCLHHALRLEPVAYPIEKRIKYVLIHKSSQDLVCRLNNMRPVLSALPESVVASYEKYEKALHQFRASKNVFCKAKITVEAAGEGLEEEDACSARTKAYFAENVAELDGKMWNDHDVCIDAKLEFMQMCKSEAQGLNLLHRVDVPHHTWNGKNIF